MSADPKFIKVGFFKQNISYEPMIDEFTNEKAEIEFNIQESIFVWSRTAEADDHKDKEHEHWNAAANMFYKDGVFSWEEFGPAESEDDVKGMVATSENGVRKVVTEGVQSPHGGDFGYFLDHHEMFLKIIEVID